MTFCSFEILKARGKIPDSRVVAFDDNLKFIDDVNDLI
jgi:hypothetical protein